MLDFILASLLCILLNLNYLAYNETLLLFFFFLIFYIFIYFFIKKIYKLFNLKKILKIYYIFLFFLKMNFNLNKLLCLYLIIKKNIIKKIILKLSNLEYLINFILNNLFEKYKVLINIQYLYSNINYFKNLKETLINFILNLINKLSSYDNILFN